jgi:hypothetical protein
MLNATPNTLLAGVSPMTEQPIKVEMLFPNHAVRSQIAISKLPLALVPYTMRTEAARKTMRDPVVAQDGSTYERSAITAYITEHGVSPITGQPMNAQHLYRNTVVAHQIAVMCLPPQLLPFALRSEEARLEMRDPVMACDGQTYPPTSAAKPSGPLHSHLNPPSPSPSHLPDPIATVNRLGVTIPFSIHSSRGSRTWSP